MTDVSGAAANLERRAWVTAGARFNACQRLLNRASLAVWAVSLMAVYTIALSLATVTIECLAKPPILIWASLVTVMLSLLVLVISIIESMREHSRVAYIHHSTALRIREIHNAVEAARMAGTLDLAGLDHWRGEYDGALREAQLNHSDIDVVRFELERMIDRSSAPYPPLNRRKCITKRSKYILLWLREYAAYLGCILVPPVAVLLMAEKVLLHCNGR
jgi:hypothetical protein